MNWQQELNLLNDDQLSRIAFAEKDSWEFGFHCCVLGRALELYGKDVMREVDNYRNQLDPNLIGRSPLEEFYMSAVIKDENYKTVITHHEIITEIQAEALRILAERRAKVGDQIHSDTPVVTLTSQELPTAKSHYRTYPNSSAVGMCLPDGEPTSERLERVKAIREFSRKRDTPNEARLY